jgi:hypothetical protein
MKKLIILAGLFVFVISGIFQTANAEKLNIPEGSYAFEVKGRVLDIHKKLRLGIGLGDLGVKKEISGLDMLLDSSESVDDKFVHPAITAFLTQEDFYADCPGIDWQVKKCLTDHRKTLGLGVFGVLKVEGRLYVYAEKDDKGVTTLSANIFIKKLSGPKGDFTSKK